MKGIRPNNILWYVDIDYNNCMSGRKKVIYVKIKTKNGPEENISVVLYVPYLKNNLLNADELVTRKKSILLQKRSI